MGKCADCGYLAVRSKVDYSLSEASVDYRNKGAVAIGYDDTGQNQHQIHELFPLCFARQPYLKDVIKKIDDTKNKNDEVKRVINEEIPEGDCKEFTEWQQGFTPKEHREMLDEKWKMEFQKQREEDDRNWRTSQDKEQRKWQTDQNIRLIIIAGCFTVLGAVIGAIVGKIT
ncbi:hypothetical protein ACFLTS_05140 [Chloroflexota bacterium]